LFPLQVTNETDKNSRKLLDFADFHTGNTVNNQSSLFAARPWGITQHPTRTD
jgi:hypothetical protein